MSVHGQGGARRRRVLWVNQFAVLPSDGGGTRHFELGRELVQRGWDVTIEASDLHLHRREYTRRADAAHRGDIIEVVEGVRLRWLWARAYQRNNWQRVWNWLSFWSSVRSQKDGSRPDVVIGSSPQLFAAHAAYLVARRHKVPFVLEIRDLWPESLLAVGARPGPGYWAFKLLAQFLYRKADKIIVLAAGVRDYLVEHGVPAEKLVLVPNGVDVHLVVPRRGGREEGDGGRTVFVYAGAHGPANGLDSVLDAADRLRDAPVEFHLVGDGPAKAELVAEARRLGLGSVRFLDGVPKSELVSLFQSADAGLMILRDAPLFSFGVSPNKLFDYLAAGLPVLCNVPGEVATMLRESGGGLQLAAADGAALAEGVRKFLAIPRAERERMGALGREWVQREHSREVLGDRLHRHLTEVASTLNE